MTAPRTAKVYDIERDRPQAELREWSDSDMRLGNLLEEERLNWEAGQVAGRMGRVLLVCAGVWIVVVGVMIVCK